MCHGPNRTNFGDAISGEGEIGRTVTRSLEAALLLPHVVAVYGISTCLVPVASTITHRSDSCSFSLPTHVN